MFSYHSQLILHVIYIENCLTMPKYTLNPNQFENFILNIID